MNFDYTDDQKFLKSEARKFLEAQCTSDRVRKVLNDEAVSFDTDLWRQVRPFPSNITGLGSAGSTFAPSPRSWAG